MNLVNLYYMLEYLKACSFSVKVLLLAYALVLYNSILLGTSYYTLIFCIMVLAIVPAIKLKVDSIGKCLVCFSLSYSLMLIANGLITSHLPLYLLAPIIFYSFGGFMVQQLHSRSAIMGFVSITLFLFSTITFYTCLLDIGEVGLINPIRKMGRSGVDDYGMAATLYGLNVSLGLSSLFAFLSINKTDRTKVHYFMLLSFIMSALTTFHLLNRTGLVLICSSLLLFLWYGKFDKMSNWGILLFVVVIVLYLSSKSDFLDVVNAYSNRAEIEGHGFSDAGSRSQLWYDAIMRLPSNIFGWHNKVSYSYTHNMWLDVARQAGLFPFVAIVGVSVYAIKDSIRLSKTKNDYVVLGILSIHVAFLLESFVEPVLEGFDLYFYLYCMFLGVQKKYLNMIQINIYKNE